jgi:hypothetical protein
MGLTWALICHSTKQQVTVGKGYDDMGTFWSGNKEIMERLGEFLNETRGLDLVLLNMDQMDHITDDCYEEFGDTHG